MLARRTLYIATCIAVVHSAQASADFKQKLQSNNLSIRRPFENIGATLAWGYDSRTGEFKQPCLDFDPKKIKSAPITGSGNGEFSKQSFDVVESYEDMASSLDLDFSASMRYLLASANVGFSLSKKHKISKYSSTSILHLYMEKTSRFIESATPKSGISQLAKSKQQFRDKCGDSFIYAVVDGGELNAVISASGSTNSEEETIKASFSVATRAYQGNGNLGTALEQMSRASNFSIKVYTAGGEATYVTKDLEARASSFFQKARENPIAVEFRTIGYENILGLLPATYEVEPTKIGYCAMELTRFLDGLEYIDANRDKFLAVGADELVSEIDQVKREIASIAKLRDKNTEDWSHVCPLLPDLPQRTETFPVDVKSCGWNQMKVLSTTRGGWQIRARGAWCEVDNVSVCDKKGYQDPGISTRCDGQGDDGLKRGPCNLQVIVGDNYCLDNVSKSGNPSRVEVSELLKAFDIGAYEKDLNVAKTPKRDPAK